MSWLRRRKTARPKDGAMTLMAHLYELRRRMFFAVLAILLGTIVGFIWFTVEIPALRIRSLGDLLIAPYCAVPEETRITYGSTDDCWLLATTPFSALQLRLTAAVLAGVILTSPIWLYQLWAYIGPALYSKEKKFAIGFTAIGAVLFTFGMVLAYLIIPEALKVLLAFGGDFVKAGLDPERYYKFLLGMMLIFGVSLELPLLLVMLNFAGVLKGAKLAQIRRFAYFGLVVFSAFAVPGNDPISMGVLAIALCLLYEVAVQVTKAHDRRKAKRQAAAEAELPDDEASPLAHSGDAELAADGDVGTVSPIDSPAPLEPVQAAPPTAPTPTGAPPPTPPPEGDNSTKPGGWLDAT